MNANTASNILDATVVAFYQSIVDLATGETVGMEALARFQTPDGDIHGPGAAFAAGWNPEDVSRQMVDIVIAERAQQADATWYAAINLPAKLFVDASIREHVADLLAATGLNPAYIMVELTEETAWNVNELATSFAAWHAIGVKTAVDDYGSGYNDATVVTACAPSLVKVDRTLLTAAKADPRILRDAATLAFSVQALCVVEGAEDADQVALIAAAGIGRVQGFFFGQPAPLGAHLA